MTAGDEIAIARAKAERVPAEERSGLRAPMRGFDDRQHLGAPAGLVQARAEVDIFVVREEALVEN